MPVEEVFCLEIRVIKGDGLAAKDATFFGLVKTSSDPYVEVRLLAQGPNTLETDKVFLGRTRPVMQSLSPTWDSITFTAELATRYFTEEAMFELTIMDYDSHNEDDLMGVVPVHIPIHHHALQNRQTVDITKWYHVPATSANGEEATGRIQCSLVVKKEMKRT